MKKALKVAGSWLLILLAFAMLVVLVGPWLVIAQVVELVED